jgi:trk system potassium uptake protein TrkA
MRVVIIGCGRAGAELAHRLSARNHDVVVVDESAAAFGNLRPDFRGRTLEGDVLAEDVLRRAAIERAEGLAAMTNSDSVNAVVAHVARTVFGVENVVVRSYAPSWMPLHEAFGFQVVSSTQWAAQRIEQLLVHGLGRAVFSAGNGEIVVYEVKVPESWHGRGLGELLGRDPCVAVALTRGGRAQLPQASTRMEQGDVLHVGATLEGVEGLTRRLQGSGRRT